MDDNIENNDQTNHEEVKEEIKEVPKEEPKEEIKMEETPTKSKFWMIATIILAILLILAIWTKGFSGITGNTVAEDTLLDEPEVALTTGDFSYIILNDNRCAECDTTGLQAQLSQVFPGAEVKQIDYNTEEGATLFKKLELEALPAVLFTESITTNANYAQVADFIEPKGKFLSLKIGATHDPNGEICDNGIDDNEDGKIDCADTDCASSWKCLPKQEKPLAELFVWSFCPGGISGENTLYPVVETLGEKFESKITFIGPVTTDKQTAAYSCFSGRGKELDEALDSCCETYELDGEEVYSCGLHNQPGDHEESIESARQVCIRENYGQTEFWKYLNEYNSNCINKRKEAAAYKTCLDAAMKDAGISTTKVKTCMENGEAIKYLMEDSELSDKYEIHASPTLYINGVQFEGQRTPAGFQEGICLGFNTKPSACGDTVSAAADVNADVSCG